MCSCPLTTTKNFVTCSLSSTTISSCSTVRPRPCASTRARWAEVRTGNISLGVLPGGGDKTSSSSGSFDILSCRLDGGSRVVVQAVEPTAHPNLLHSLSLDRRNCPAVNDVFASGDRGSTIRCQKRHQLGDFVRAIRPAERDAAE